MQLQFGLIEEVLWLGDFNARIGNLLHSQPADPEINTRGRVLASFMGS
jgi:hypothetical protein